MVTELQPPASSFIAFCQSAKLYKFLQQNVFFRSTKIISRHFFPRQGFFSTTFWLKNVSFFKFHVKSDHVMCRQNFIESLMLLLVTSDDD